MASILRLFQEKIGSLIDDPDSINKNYSEVKIDAKAVQKTKKFAVRHRCSQRLGKGLFFTDAEKKKSIKKMRHLTLP